MNIPVQSRFLFGSSCTVTVSTPGGTGETLKGLNVHV